METHFIPSNSEKSSDDDYDESLTDHENDESDLELLVEVLEESDDELAINTSSFEAGHSIELRSMIKLLQFVSLFLLKFRAVYRISDNAMQVLLKFLKKFIELISSALFVDQNSLIIRTLADRLPTTLKQCILGPSRNNWKEFIVCTKCHTLYSGCESSKMDHLCNHIEYPEHPHKSFRRPCGNNLFKTVRTKGNKLIKIPRKIFYYREIKESIQKILQQPGLLHACNTWKDRMLLDSCNMLGDVVDGCVWHDILKQVKKPLSHLNTFGLLLNFDWYQPYKHVSYSVGVIYGALINLPRHLRYKLENIIIIGVIPGPHEPKNLNSYFGIMVQELLSLWKGVWIDLSHGRTFITVFLTGLAADIPASRKAGGFCGHNASKGCSRCLKTFMKKYGEKTDYSGFDVENWPERCEKIHKDYGYKVLTASTRQERKDIAKEYGARYSVLFELPYYNCIRSVPIDPMHNLFLGTAKHIMNTWKSLELLDKTKFFHYTVSYQIMQCT